MRLIKTSFLALLLLTGTVSGSLASAGQERPGIAVEEFFLENGMQFLIVQRTATPQVACRVAIRAGSALESAGKTGIAHMLEHMMFKGTKNFGTTDYEKDRQLQQQIEAAHQVIAGERRKRHPDDQLIKSAQEKMKSLRLKVQQIYVPQAFSSQVGKNGAVSVNAFTSRDQTQYTMSVPSDMIEQWFSIVSEQLFEPSWREFYVEKEVIQREWAFRYVNSPGGAAWLDLNATAYQAHPYRNPVIGWKGDIENFSTRDAVAFHRKFYAPGNAVCVLVGDISADKARRLAEMYFSRYPAGSRAPESVTPEPRQQGIRKSVRYLKGARTPLVRIGFHGAAMGTPDFYALDALTMVLGHGRSARLTQKIVKKGLAMDAWAYNPDNRFGGMVILGGSPNETPITATGNNDASTKGEAHLKACGDLEALLLEQLEGMKTDLVSERELTRIKKLNQRDFLDRMRSNESLAGTLATLEVQVGWRYLNNYLENMTVVSAEDIRRVARKYFNPDNQTTVFVIPGGTPEKPPQAYTEIRSLGSAAAGKVIATADFINHSRYPTPGGWKHPLSFQRRPTKIHYPKAQSETIGDTRVFFLPDTQLPLIDLNLMVKAGAVDLPPGLIGLDELLSATIISGGTEALAPEELARVLDENAIKMSVSVNEEYSQISLSVMKNDWQRGIDLLREVLTRPRFDARIIDVAKRQAVTALKRQGENAHAVSGREWMIRHFKGHPYGRDPLAGIETIPRIGDADLKRFLSGHFVPGNITAAVSGDIDRQKAVDGIGGLLASLAPAPAMERRLARPAETPPVMILIHKPGQVQSQVTLGMSSVRRTDPDFWKINLLASVFGGDDSLLYKRLRDDLGLVYSAGFYQTYRWKAGMLVGYIGCKGDQTARAVRETAQIMEQLQRGVPETEFERKRIDILNSFVFNVDSPSELVSVYARYHMRGEPLDTLETIQDAYIAATAGGLQGLARRFLDPGRLQLVVVADKTLAVTLPEGENRLLGEDLQLLAREMGIEFEEIELR